MSKQYFWKRFDYSLRIRMWDKIITEPTTREELAQSLVHAFDYNTEVSVVGNRVYAYRPQGYLSVRRLWHYEPCSEDEVARYEEVRRTSKWVSAMTIHRAILGE